jgi:hypothetical protein
VKRAALGRGEMVFALLLALVVAFASALAGCGRSGPSRPIEVPEGVDHTEWNRLLHAYVDDKGLVDYARWKASDSDMRALGDYLSQLAPAPRRAAVGADQQATLVNAYNAFTIRWILDHYPTESIQSLPNSFGEARHRIGGQDVSLDDIENGMLRPEVGFRVHSVLVCAARSSPPLSRDAIRADRFIDQISFGMVRWVWRDDLNHFDPDQGRAEISYIFKRYAEDFESAKGGLRGVLSIYAPNPSRSFISEPTSKISYKDFDWGLNDQGPHGRDYRRGLWQRIKGLFR